MPDPTGEREPYSLEPGEESVRSVPPSQPPAPGASGARIAADPLLASFPTDADFNTDPELERAVAGPPKAGEPVKVAVELPEIVKPGLGDAKVWGIVGAVLTAATVIAIMVLVPATNGPTVTARLLRACLAVYDIALHAGTGVAAMYIAAFLTERRVTRVELVAARLLTAVAAFALVVHLRVPVEGDYVRTGIYFLLGVAAYIGLVAVLFRLPWRSFQYLVGAHFTLWLVIQLGMSLAAKVG